jgi:hypothetical protein
MLHLLEGFPVERKMLEKVAEERLQTFAVQDALLRILAVRNQSEKGNTRVAFL